MLGRIIKPIVRVKGLNLGGLSGNALKDLLNIVQGKRLNPVATDF